MSSSFIMHNNPKNYILVSLWVLSITKDMISLISSLYIRPHRQHRSFTDQEHISHIVMAHSFFFLGAAGNFCCAEQLATELPIAEISRGTWSKSHCASAYSLDDQTCISWLGTEVRKFVLVLFESHHICTKQRSLMAKNLLHQFILLTSELGINQCEI